MAIFKLSDEKLIELEKTSFANEHILEARDLQKFIINSIDAIEPGLYVLASEFGDWEDSRRKVDILCLDKAANLVVVELKRTEDGGHMELQSIRYASMVAHLTFDKAVKAHQSYLSRKGNHETNAEAAILEFLEWDESNEDAFGNEVRIILVSADFSKEITNSVLWLIDFEIDIKCIRITPQKDGDRLYLDIQQIIPPPETADYQVKLREKTTEQRQARRESNRDYTKFNLNLNGVIHKSLNKRETMILAIRHCVDSGIAPALLIEFTGKGRWISVDKICKSTQEFEKKYIGLNKRKYDPARWFNGDDQLLIFDGKTYAFSNQHGKGTGKMVSNIFSKYPELNATIETCIE
ncbi:hypothetical protein AWW68_09255 [Roseivirga spongicola]|jgi:hypothetical protein|uniref:DUF91 domain-containing protein n=1 Tax=Roseivirga spongicola TaxID=333140 RepID=A0A150XBA1_9BACT|nr:endonuclease NucS domain-containing protein [Roseivirga spongicola]KYG76005.1 hypothetical protein AWW68_09255 [Roseivirga spongicola]